MPKTHAPTTTQIETSISQLLFNQTQKKTGLLYVMENRGGGVARISAGSRKAVHSLIKLVSVSYLKVQSYFYYFKDSIFFAFSIGCMLCRLGPLRNEVIGTDFGKTNSHVPVTEGKAVNQLLPTPFWHEISIDRLFIF